MNPPRCAILAADFAKAVMDTMIDEARQEIADAGATLVTTVRVAGSYELPLLADALLSRPDVDVLIVLGYIERGETLHGQVMGHVVQAALVDLQLKHRKPVGIGIIGPGATMEQAEARKVDYARAAVRAAVRSWAALGEVLRGTD